jgi:hypothetical protein
LQWSTSREQAIRWLTHYPDAPRSQLDETTALRQLRAEVAEGGRDDKWQVVDGLITKADKIYVPANSPHLPTILSAVHDMGHEGAEKTLHMLRRDFYVPGARSVVQEHVRACAVCQRNKVEKLHPVGLLQPLDVPGATWSHITMDFVEGFPRISSKSVILTVVDRFSKYAHFLPIGHPYTATSVTKVFFDSMVRLHGIPESIVSNHDPVFTSKFWT